MLAYVQNMQQNNFSKNRPLYFWVNLALIIYGAQIKEPNLQEFLKYIILSLPQGNKNEDIFL